MNPILEIILKYVYSKSLYFVNQVYANNFRASDDDVLEIFDLEGHWLQFANFRIGEEHGRIIILHATWCKNNLFTRPTEKYYNWSNTQSGEHLMAVTDALPNRYWYSNLHLN